MARRTALHWIDCEWNPVVVRDLKVHLCPETLCVPLRWRKPRLALTGNCGDLFFEEVPDDCIAHVFAVMQSSAAHTFRIHTRHPERMATLLRSPHVLGCSNGFRSRGDEAAAGAKAVMAGYGPPPRRAPQRSPRRRTWRSQLST